MPRKSRLRRLKPLQNRKTAKPSESSQTVISNQLDLSYTSNPALYHQIWRTLFNGDETPGHRRPRLPVELVRLISRLADLHTTWTHVCDKNISVHSSGPLETRLWFCTPPLSNAILKSGIAVQLFTTSNDQGWAGLPDLGSWTWFEWGLFASVEEATNRASSGSEGWRESHRNKVAVEQPQSLEGPLVTMGDDMWNGTVEGSVLAVRVCAQFGGWANHAHNAEVKFSRWFEPVIDL